MYKLRLTDLLICCICSIFSPSVSKKKCCKWILWQLGCPTAGVAGGIQMLCLAKLQQWGRVEVQDPRSSSEKEQDCRHINGKKYWTICHYPDPYISACQFVSNNILEHMQRSVTVCGTRVSSQKCLSNVPLQCCRMKICCDNFCMFLPSFSSDLESIFSLKSHYGLPSGGAVPTLQLPPLCHHPPAQFQFQPGNKRASSAGNWIDGMWRCIYWLCF